METQTFYQEALKFATCKHLEKDQKVPGTNMPYVVHLSNVAMEILLASAHSAGFDLSFAVQVALLHDTLEDTETSFQELETNFGIEVANAVLALSKNHDLPKDQQMTDCLARIKQLKAEVWAVKLADRITNLQTPPPHWDNFKKSNYQKEARVIWNELKSANDYLANRLATKIEEYTKHIIL